MVIVMALCNQGPFYTPASMHLSWCAYKTYTADGLEKGQEIVEKPRKRFSEIPES